VIRLTTGWSFHTKRESEATTFRFLLWAAVSISDCSSASLAMVAPGDPRISILEGASFVTSGCVQNHLFLELLINICKLIVGAFLGVDLHGEVGLGLGHKFIVCIAFCSCGPVGGGLGHLADRLVSKIVNISAVGFVQILGARLIQTIECRHTSHESSAVANLVNAGEFKQ
jgi:hypothetical protein